jgi:hypothetical protein
MSRGRGYMIPSLELAQAIARRAAEHTLSHGICPACLEQNFSKKPKP